VSKSERVHMQMIHRNRRVGSVLAGGLLVVVVCVLAPACSDYQSTSGLPSPQQQREEDVIAGFESSEYDLTVAAALTPGPQGPTSLHVRVENVGFQPAEDIHLSFVVPPSAAIQQPLPTGCTRTTGEIECKLGLLDIQPNPTDDPPRSRPWFAELDFTIDTQSSHGEEMAISVNSSIGGGYEERARDHTPADNTITVTL
jgi:hypothetical protein